MRQADPIDPTNVVDNLKRILAGLHRLENAGFDQAVADQLWQRARALRTHANLGSLRSTELFIRLTSLTARLANEPEAIRRGWLDPAVRCAGELLSLAHLRAVPSGSELLVEPDDDELAWFDFQLSTLNPELA